MKALKGSGSRYVAITRFLVLSELSEITLSIEGKDEVNMRFCHKSGVCRDYSLFGLFD